MDLIDLYPLIGLVIDGFIIGFIANNYRKTHYMPSLMFLLLYSVFVTDYIIWIPISALGEDQFIPAQTAMLIAIFVVLTIPCFTIAFFQSTRNQSFTLLLGGFIFFYFFILGYSFSINWVFIFDRIWRYQISGIVLVLFILPFAVAGFYVFIILVQLFFSRFERSSIKLKEKYGKGSKNLVFLWAIGLAVRYYSTYLIAAEGVSIVIIFIRIGSMITMAIAFLYNPDSFFFSNAHIKSYFIFNAASGNLVFSMGNSEDDVRVSGLFGASMLQGEITGASGLPHILMFVDRVVLIESQEINNQFYSAAIIVDKYNPVFVHSLKFSLLTFIKTYKANLKEDIQDQSIFKDFTSKVQDIFSYAYPQENINEMEEH